jgi:hypothetical protein
MALQVVDVHGAAPDDLAHEHFGYREGINKDSRPAVLAFNRSLEPWLVNGRKHDSVE